MKKVFIAVALSSALLAGCAATGEDLAADVYSADQVNTKLKPVMVKILAVMPAKVAVDNTQNKKMAQVAGGVFGTILGAVTGYQHNYQTAAIAGAGVGTAGALAGSMVKDKVLVPGVTITYRSRGSLYSSTQVGKKCQFKKGTALMVKTMKNETRIQPNAECPVKK